MSSKLRPHDPRAPPSLRVGQRSIPPVRRWRRARRSSSSASTPAAASSRRRAPSPTSATLDFGKVNPVTGPIYRRRGRAGRRAEGDDRGVRALRLRLDGEHPGLRAARRPVHRPGADTLDLRHGDAWRRRCSASTARVPLKPFAGTIGLAPAEPGLHSVVPPRRVGGNLDIRDLSAGTVLYLPVEVAGALFSVGDTHAAQGDGEVCGTAIESPMNVVLKFDLVKGAQPEDAALHHAGPGDAPSRRQGLRGDDRHRPRPDGGRARRGRQHDRPARRALRHRRRSTPTCSARSAAISASARSSTCRTGWCRSTSRGASSSDGSGPPRSAALAGPASARARCSMSRPDVAVRGEDGARVVVDDLSFDARARRDALHRRRVRLRQVDDGAVAHAAPAGAGGAHRRRPRSGSSGRDLTALAEARDARRARRTTSP